MSLEHILLATPVHAWKADLAIVFDWYDGPRQGVCRLAVPAAEFYFDLLDERATPDDLDDRLFRLSEITSGSVAAVLSAFRDAGHPTGPVWTPVAWFSGEAARAEAERCLQAVAASKRPTSIVVYTRDLIAFLGCWEAPPLGPNRQDWFSVLDLHQGQTT